MNSYIIVYPDELNHYGVKGMKWGIRKEKDSANKTSKFKLTSKQKKALAIGAAAVGIGVSAYVLKRYGAKNFDKVIKSGKPIQHMSRYVDELLDKPFYASHLPKDNRMYEKADFIGASQWKTKMTLSSTKDIKIAGRKNAEKIYKRWIDSNPNARERFGNQSYFSFNRNLNSPDYRDKKLFASFYDELKKQGYSAIRDVNDQSQSGATSPLIIFGGLKSLRVQDLKNIR